MDAAIRPAMGTRYTRVAIVLHWLIAALILVNLALGFFQDSLFPGTIPLHKSIGLSVLALSLVRLVWRLTHRPPPLPASVRPWERRLAHVNHALFYVVMILLPLSGWVFTSASPKRYPTSLFGLIPVPPIAAQDKAVSDTVFLRHEQLAWIMIGLLALHVAGAIKHRFVDRDVTVARMLPGAGPV